MSLHTTINLRCLLAFAAGLPLILGACGPEQARADTHSQSTRTVTVDADVALHALMSLADGHLQKIADVYSILATMDAVRSAQWEQVREPLADAAGVNVPALYWFALPDGSYYTPEAGRAEATLADRPYFSRVLAGQTIIGDLVVSRATGRSAAIVAVPVYDHAGAVAGVLGASVYMDRLSERIKTEMNLGLHHVFFSLDETPIVGLHQDPEVIFVHPLEEDDPQLTSAISTMLSHDHGVVTYRFREQQRTIHYRRSPVTGWWYGFGQVYE